MPHLSAAIQLNNIYIPPPVLTTWFHGPETSLESDISVAHLKVSNSFPQSLRAVNTSKSFKHSPSVRLSVCQTRAL